MSLTHTKSSAGRDRVALVTGGTGFVGSHLLKRLEKDGWEVHAVVQASSLRKAEGQGGAIIWHPHDGSTAGMLAILQAVQPRVVFHLASLFLAQHQPEDVESLIASNILFGTQLLEAMAQCGVRYLVNTGTSWQNYENEDYNPVCLYAATKQAFEDLARYYVEAEGLQVITLRLFDTYGPDDPRPKLLNLLKSSLISGENLALSPGEQMIDLVYIDDVVEAFICASRLFVDQQHTFSEVFAVTSGKPISLRKLVDVINGVVGNKLHVSWGARPYRPREVMIPWSDGKILPGWTPQVELRSGLMEIFEGL